MKLLTTFILATLISSTSYAGNSRFECSNQDGSIFIFDGGENVNVHGTNYASDVELKDINSLGAGFGRGDVEIVKGGKRTLLYKEVNNSCGKSGKLNFSQKLIIRDKDSRKAIATDVFVCEYDYVYEIGGDDCANE